MHYNRMIAQLWKNLLILAEFDTEYRHAHLCFCFIGQRNFRQKVDHEELQKRIHWQRKKAAAAAPWIN